MAEVKWIKITTTMFDDEKIKLIDSMPERDTIFYIWMRLLVQAAKTNAGGYIFLNENVPYTEEMLSTIFNRPLNSVRLALQTLNSFGMVKILENNLIKITNWEKHQSINELNRIREQTRQRVAKHRAKQKELLEPSKEETITSNADSNVTVTLSHATEGEVEGEEDIEVDKDITTTSTTSDVSPDYVKFFNSNFGHLMTPHELEILQSYEQDGITKEVITLALEEAVEADARDIRYIRTVLNRWLENKLTTVEAVEADKRNFENKKKKSPYKAEGSSVPRTKYGTKIDSFNGYPQRPYDGTDGGMTADELEKKLLGWE